MSERLSGLYKELAEKVKDNKLSDTLVYKPELIETMQLIRAEVEKLQSEDLKQLPNEASNMQQMQNKVHNG